MSSRASVHKNISEYYLEKPIIISILDTHKLSGNFKKIKTDRPLLTLRFNDATPKGIAKKMKLFTKEDAKKIIDFVIKNHYKTRCIIVHCARGVSRSAAIAAGLLYGYYGVTGFAEKPPYKPNKHVMKIMIDEIQKHIDKVNYHA